MCLLAVGLVLPACSGRAAVQQAPPALDGDRLLTGLSAQVTRGGVSLTWQVDESRAHRITGFSCVYRTPGHISLGVAGAEPCGSQLSAAEARALIVVGLPEFGDYDFEVVAQVGPGEAIDWPKRALKLRVTVTEERAGWAGPGRVVTGTGPVVTGCGPEGGPGDASQGRPWHQDEIVSAAHLTHYPGRGWTAGGDPDTPPEWPEPVPLDELFDQAGLDGQVVGQALSGGDTDDAAALLADDRALTPLGQASAGTKALLRPGTVGGWELRLHTSYPFGADYVYTPAHTVAGWGHPSYAGTGARLWNLTNCPPPGRPDATHDVALALSDDAGDGRRLEHSGYGWWAVAPVGMFPQRMVATKAALSYGEPADRGPEAPATYRGRASGHVFWNEQRFALAGDVVLTYQPASDGAQLSGRLHNVVLTPISHPGLQPQPDSATAWRSLALEAGTAGGGAWSGTVAVGQPLGEGAKLNQRSSLAERPEAPDEAEAEPALAGFPAPNAFTGDWRAEAYGPDASEIAGRLRLYTPLPANADPGADWPAQALIVAGFAGAAS